MLDIIDGSKTLFTRDEIEASWHFIDQVKVCNNCLVIYENEQEVMENQIIEQKEIWI